MGKSMTITRDKFYGGYNKVTVDGSYYLASLSSRFIRAIAVNNEDILYLPRANELPVTTGAPVFTLWNEGYNNLHVKDANGGFVGCVQGTCREPSTSRCKTNVYLINASSEDGEWKMDCSTCYDPSVTVTSTWSVTGDGGTTASQTETSEGHTTGYQFTMAVTPPKPIPFPRHPEIPMPTPKPKRAAEGM